MNSRIQDSYQTLPDYLAEGLDIVSIGLNPSLASVAAGFYFANPRNRFWRALNASMLAPRELAPSRTAQELLFKQCRLGFTDVVKRPTSSASQLSAQDFRQSAPVLKRKLLRYQPQIAWFHGKVAFGRFMKYAEGSDLKTTWGLQEMGIGAAHVFVTPNPSPANAAYSLEELVYWYHELNLLREVVR